MNNKPLVIAIIAKSVEHILPLYLESLISQTEVGSNTIFWIRTNDNRDNTSQLLEDFYNKYKGRFKMVFDSSSVDSSIINVSNHEWNKKRFKILGKIRQDSIQFAQDEGADYFVADTDNIMLPHTIEELRKTGLDCISPFLKNLGDRYANCNYFTEVDKNGFYKFSELDPLIWRQSIKGLLQVPIVHCTYYLQNRILKDIVYDDGSDRFEFVIFSENLRKKGIPQYLDNREIYGRLFFSTNQNEFEMEKSSKYYTELVSSISEKNK